MAEIKSVSLQVSNQMGAVQQCCAAPFCVRLAAFIASFVEKRVDIVIIVRFTDIQSVF